MPHSTVHTPNHSFLTGHLGRAQAIPWAGEPPSSREEKVPQRTEFFLSFFLNTSIPLAHPGAKSQPAKEGKLPFADSSGTAFKGAVFAGDRAHNRHLCVHLQAI